MDSCSFNESTSSPNSPEVAVISSIEAVCSSAAVLISSMALEMSTNFLFKTEINSFVSEKRPNQVRVSGNT